MEPGTLSNSVGTIQLPLILGNRRRRKKTVTGPGAEQLGHMQNPPGPWHPLSVLEIRRPLWRLVSGLQRTTQHIMPRCRWRHRR